MVGYDSPLADPRMFNDPSIARINQLLHLRVGEDPFRQIRPPTCDASMVIQALPLSARFTGIRPRKVYQIRAEPSKGRRSRSPSREWDRLLLTIPRASLTVSDKGAYTYLL